MNVPALFVTQRGQRVIAPERSGAAVVDPETGEVAFRAWVCTNPSCPGKQTDGDPLLFIWEDPLFSVGEDGTLQYEEVPNREELIVQRGGFLEPTCPACYEHRNRAGESAEERQQYADWCRIHVLPQSAKRLKELDEEHTRRLESVKRRRTRVERD